MLQERCNGGSHWVVLGRGSGVVLVRGRSMSPANVSVRRSLRQACAGVSRGVVLAPQSDSSLCWSIAAQALVGVVLLRSSRGRSRCRGLAASLGT